MLRSMKRRKPPGSVGRRTVAQIKIFYAEGKRVFIGFGPGFSNIALLEEADVSSFGS